MKTFKAHFDVVFKNKKTNEEVSFSVRVSAMTEELLWLCAVRAAYSRLASLDDKHLTLDRLYLVTMESRRVDTTPLPEEWLSEV